MKPELSLFVDDVGANMSQQEDGNIGGEKLLVAKDERALCQSAMNNCHFTCWVLPLPVGSLFVVL